jgi:predicted dehydrogenase
MSPPAPPLRWGVLGTGSIAAEVTEALALTEHGRAYAVASRDAARAADFAREHRVERSAGSYEELLADPDVELVYVATPHTLHARWATAAIEAGKHVLCEKPLTVNEAQAAPLFELARARGCFLMEAFAYWFHPQTAVLAELIGSGAIGRVRGIDITFSYASDAGDGGRATSRALGGGGILDVGCYCTSMAQRIVAAATGLRSPEPEEVTALAVLDPAERTDLYALAAMRFPADILAQLACGVMLTQDDHIRVYGTDGQLHIGQPAWLPGYRDAASAIEITPSGSRMHAIEIEGARSIFALQADGVAEMLRRDVTSCRPTWSDTLANMRTLDRWRRAVGVRYDGEGI